LLAETVIKDKLGLLRADGSEPSIGYDCLLPSKVKVDIKCRGGVLPFQQEYPNDDGIGREAKHNFFARQIYDTSLDTDIYLMTHLETPSNRELPGTKRQRKWILYICGWVSKKRVLREGVYLPRGSLTEQGRTWFTYRGQEIEFYNQNLNGLANLEDMLKIDQNDVVADENKKGGINLTRVDALRIVYDLIGRGVLNEKHLELARNVLNLPGKVSPILQSNQYFHLLRWLKENGALADKEITRLKLIMEDKPFEGI